MLLFTIFEIVGLASIISLITFLKDPYLIQNFLNNIFNDYSLNFKIDDENFTYVILNFFILLYLTKLLFSYFYISYLQGFVMNFDNKLNNVTLKKYYYEYFESFQNRSENLLSSFTNRIPRIAGAAVFLSTIITECLILFFIFILIILSSDFETLIAIFLFVLISLPIYLISSNRIKKYSYLRGKFMNSNLEFLREFFDGIKEILVYRSGHSFVDQFFSLHMEALKPQKKIGILNSFPKIILETIFILSIIFSIILVSRNYDTLDIFFIKFGAFFILLIRIIPSITRIMFNTNNFKYSFEPIDTIYEDLEKIQKKKEEIEYKFSNEITINNLNFQFDEKNKILENLNLKIRKNEKVLIEGKSGSGKSTLIDLLIGILKIDSGEIKIDDLNININTAKWIDLISYVPQNAFLQNKTLKFNITFEEKEEDIDENLLRDSLKISGLEKEIEKGTLGLDQLIQIKSKNLSGGQKQRVSIARAIYKNSPVIILDESTNSLDEISEQEIIKSLNEMTNKTLIVVSHNQNLKKMFKKIYKLDSGKLNPIAN